jgi:tetratricopeptide (TPR) repeat protein
MHKNRVADLIYLSMEEQPNPETLVANFQSLSAEGDLLLQKGAFHEAIKVFSKALEIRPTDKHCLVARSRCYIQVGSAKEALADANQSLKEDPQYHRGIYLKAEALYAQGDFEMALLYFHRGNKLRPELSEFRVGILKSREAIHNSIGDPKRKIRVSPRVRKTLQLDPKLYTDLKLPTQVQGKLLQELYDDQLYLQVLFVDVAITQR